MDDLHPIALLTKQGVPKVLPFARVAKLYLLVPVHAVVSSKILATPLTDKRMATVLMTLDFFQGDQGVLFALYY